MYVLTMDDILLWVLHPWISCLHFFSVYSMYFLPVIHALYMSQNGQWTLFASTTIFIWQLWTFTFIQFIIVAIIMLLHNCFSQLGLVISNFSVNAGNFWNSFPLLWQKLNFYYPLLEAKSSLADLPFALRPSASVLGPNCFHVYCTFITLTFLLYSMKFMALPRDSMDHTEKSWRHILNRTVRSVTRIKNTQSELCLFHDSSDSLSPSMYWIIFSFFCSIFYMDNGAM